MVRPSDVRIVEKLTGEQDEELIAVLLDDAESFVLAYTMRTKIIQPLEKPVRVLLTVNRLQPYQQVLKISASDHHSYLLQLHL